MLRPFLLAATILAAPAFLTNPLMSPSPLPSQAPPFDEIKDGDYQLAIKRA
ncbi:MAG: hypothetical protein V4610_06155 [Pseudomonadota bacterium]|jgi:peptidyl-dipeptidase Dcp